MSETTTEEMPWPPGGPRSPEQDQAEIGASVPDASELAIEDINPLNAHLFADDRWQGHFERLRKEDPVHFNEIPAAGRYWSLTKYDDVREVDGDWKNFSSASGITLGPPVASLPTEGSSITSFISMDPPGPRRAAPHRTVGRRSEEPAQPRTAHPGTHYLCARLPARGRDLRLG